MIGSTYFQASLSTAVWECNSYKWRETVVGACFPVKWWDLNSELVVPECSFLVKTLFFLKEVHTLSTEKMQRQMCFIPKLEQFNVVEIGDTHEY